MSSCSRRFLSYSTSGIDFSPSMIRERIFSTLAFSNGSMLSSRAAILSIFSLNFLWRAAPSCIRNSVSFPRASLMALVAASHSSSVRVSVSVFVSTSGILISVASQSAGSGMLFFCIISFICL